ncbi:MAG: TetR/AcrR family transcriptional regulator [Candidatus Lokiarchaeota archaeon]|nr:TetR/AcrR family transcriptional regulator [Candidatus Lokiarchaeota archaeon]
MSKNKERRQEILNHALNLFVEKGYHETRTSEISESVGIASGTLFNYFDKKEELINNLYIQIKEELFSILINKKPSDEHIYSYIKRNWMNFVSWGVKNHKKVLFIMQMEDSPIISEEIKNKVEAKVADYISIYEEGITQGLLKDIPSMLGLRMYYNAVFSTINYIVKFESNITEAQQAEISEKAFNNYLYGVRL